MDYSLFCAIEYRPLSLYTDNTGQFYDVPMPGYDPAVWSVYGIYNDTIPRGSEWIADFADEKNAAKHARQIASKHNLPLQRV